MKKKTKFKLRNDLAIPFWIAIILCLIGAGVSYWLFHNSFFRALSKLDEEPIATITFKYKTAERKFLDRVVWDRLRQNSPVYNGDTIHTAELSEATVWFADETSLKLAENTMAQVFLHDDGKLAARLDSGSASVDTGEKGGGLEFSSSNVRIYVKSGSKLSAQKLDGQDLSLSVQEGDALIDGVNTVSQGNSVLLTEGTLKEPAISVISPSPNEKYLYHDTGLCPVDFQWKSKSSSNLVLQIASDRKFSKILHSINATGVGKVTVSLQKGLYYWQLVDSNKSQAEKDKVSGRFQILQSLPPSLIIPAENYSYSYRKQTPSIRFVWSDCESASAYNFAISKSPDMSSPIINQHSSDSSIIISSLTEGTYYYQVTPYYLINRAGLKNPSEIRAFKIQQRQGLKAPVLVSPINNAFIDKTKNRASLSWKMEDEQMTYKVTVSKNRNMSSPVIQKETYDNYINIANSDLANLQDGQYYWAVSQTDSEGNQSELSKVRSFYAVAGELQQRTVFPPDKYRMWKPLLGDSRFTWKTNLNYAQYLQIARDSNFNSIVYDTEIGGSAHSGVNLDEGEYYWRITTKDPGFIRGTDAKKLIIVPELDAPVLLFPTAAKRAVIRPRQPCSFIWQRSAGEDYYRIKIYHYGSDTPIYDENFIAGNKIELDVESYPEGTYRWELQSYSYETTLSSRRSSKLAESTFVLRKIRPVKLAGPQSGSVISGWSALETPPVLKWTSHEPFSRAQIILRKKTGSGRGQTVFNQKNYRQQLPSLGAGVYEWTVTAFTMDDIDMSAEESFTFTVEPIPPFEAPGNAMTEDGDFFNAKYLRKKPYIVFDWNSVNRASDYILEIKNEKDRLVLREIIDGSKNSGLKLENLSRLSKGNFTWTVKAVLMSKDKKQVLIDGESSGGTFTIDYNLNSDGGKRKDTGTLYAE